MRKKWRHSLIFLALLSIALISVALWISQATSTHHAVAPSALGKESSQQALVDSFKTGNKVSLQTITAANWKAPLSGLVNLDHPAAMHANLKDHEEAIQIYAYHVRHPDFGDFMIDTGIAEQFVKDPQSQGVPGWLKPQLGLEKLELLTTTDHFVAGLSQPLKGVFFTHLHLDHIIGMPAIERHVPLYVGQGETTEKFFLYAATRGVVDTLLAGRPALQTWTAHYVDVFGDGSVFAIHSPGHTAGSTAYLVNTDTGPVLLTGDTCHTAWGWIHHVEPGKFSTNQARSQASLNELKQLVRDHPEISVKLGHQAL